MRIVKSSLFLIALSTSFIFAQQPASTPQPKASVYVYRYKQFVGSALSPSVFCDEVQLARMENGRYFTVTLDAGQHTFRSNDSQSGVQLDLKPGQEYFIRVEIAAGMMKGHGRLILTAPEQGRYELQSNKLKPLDANKVSDTARVSVAEAKFDKPAPAEAAPAPAATPALKPAVAKQPTTDVAPDHVDQVVLSDGASQSADQSSLGDAARKARQKKTAADTTTTQPQ